MTLENTTQKKPEPGVPFIPVGGGDSSGTKWLIAAVLAAGKDGCNCDSCRLLKKFGSSLSEAVLKEGEQSGV